MEKARWPRLAGNANRYRYKSPRNVTGTTPLTQLLIWHVARRVCFRSYSVHTVGGRAHSRNHRREGKQPRSTCDLISHVMLNNNRAESRVRIGAISQSYFSLCARFLPVALLFAFTSLSRNYVACYSINRFKQLIHDIYTVVGEQ